MEMRQIEYFIAIADHGGITGAASVLGIAQATLSQALRAFERQLGAQLFHRVDSGLILSDAGRALVAPARRVLRDASNWPNVLSAGFGDLCGSLEVAVSSSLADSVVDLIADFRSRHPRVDVRLSDLRDNHLRATDIVSMGGADAVVMHLPVPDDSLTVLPLGEQEFVIAYPAGTDLPTGPVDLTQLPDLPMVSEPEFAVLAREIGATMRSWGAQPRVGVIVEHREALLPFVSAGIGAAIVDRRAAEAAEGLVMRSFEPPVVRLFGLVYDAVRQTPVAEAFAAVARAHSTVVGLYRADPAEPDDVTETLGRAPG